MNVRNHPFDAETVMAYLDGELAPAEAADIAAHLQSCPDCAKLAADFSSVSVSLAKWQVENFRPSEEHFAVSTKRVERKNNRPYPGALVWAAGIGATCLLLAAISIPNLIKSKMAANESSAVGSLRTLTTAATAYSSEHGHLPPNLQSLEGEIDSRLASGRKSGYRYTYQRFGDRYVINAEPIDPSKTGSSIFSTDETGIILANGKPLDDDPSKNFSSKLQGKEMAEKTIRPVSPVPMIARTVEFAITVQNFSAARSSLDALLLRHHGYAAQLTISGDPSSRGSLQASLRIPVSELASALSELKALGRVERESQSGEEVTMQHADLAARISNARETELRLKEILRTRTGKVSDVLAVEQQISQTRGEIERMEAELQALETRVDFATLSLNLTTENKERISELSPSAATRLHNALVSGYTDARESVVDLAVWLLSSGPQILLWLLVIAAPGFWIWRRWRIHYTRIAAA
ncbi:MAG TPA: DUF4349 domain-containing protein [Candidatus Acidoferrum sp.]|nr:DUF4349 domain-containing protein [Candidatus Acidoferrum sp.]